MSLVVKQDELLYPVPVGLFRPDVVFEPNCAAKLIDRSWLAQGAPHSMLLTFPGTESVSVDMVDPRS